MGEAEVVEGRYRAPMDAMDLIGGELCLDFVNTASEREERPMKERLWEYEDLLIWGERTGSITAVERRRLQAVAAASPDAAAAALVRARELRDAMYRVFHATQGGEAPAEEDVARVSDAAARASAAQRLVAGGSGFDLVWPESDSLDRPWWPAATSALSVLVSDELTRVKECATDNCNWLFLDMSRNRSRRWCDMKDCGNRAKARRHYARRRSS